MEREAEYLSPWLMIGKGGKVTPCVPQTGVASSCPAPIGACEGLRGPHDGRDSCHHPAVLGAPPRGTSENLWDEWQERQRKEAEKAKGNRSRLTS